MSSPASPLKASSVPVVGSVDESESSVNFFIEPWNKAGVIWENIGLKKGEKGQGPEEVVSTFRFLDNQKNITNLSTNIENNAILTVKNVDGNLKLLFYFDYGTLGVKGEELSNDEKDKLLREKLEVGDSPTSGVKVVSLLLGGIGWNKQITFKGICYDSCAKSSKISRPWGGNSTTNRLICDKRSRRNGVKIAFFPKDIDSHVDNSSDNIFYEGDIMVNDKGEFAGFIDNGKLLKKSLHDSANGYGYSIFDAKFNGNKIQPSPENALYQYSNSFVLQGYATCDFAWDFTPPNTTPSQANLSSGRNYCMNWNFGSVSIDKEINDDKVSKCSNMYYTVSRNDVDKFDSEGTRNLFETAARREIFDNSPDKLDFKSMIDKEERKIEFIVKENYTETSFENQSNLNCKLIKFRCKVSKDDIFCVIEIVVCNDDVVKFLRVYKFYARGKTDDDEYDEKNGVKKGIIKKEGIFIALNEKGKVKSVAIYQQNTLGRPYGMQYARDDNNPDRIVSKQVMEEETADEMVKLYEKKKLSDKSKGQSGAVEKSNVSKLSSKCQLLTSSTKNTSEKAIKAASACYGLFFGDTTNKDSGLVQILLSQLSSPMSSVTDAYNSSSTLFTQSVISQIVDGHKLLNQTLKEAFEVVTTSEQSKVFDISSRFHMQDIDELLPKSVQPSSLQNQSLNEHREDADAAAAAADADADADADAAAAAADARPPARPPPPPPPRPPARPPPPPPPRPPAPVHRVDEQNPERQQQGTAPVLEEGGIAIVSDDFSDDEFKGKTVFINTITRFGTYEVIKYDSNRQTIEKVIDKQYLTPYMSRVQVHDAIKSGENYLQLLTGGRGRGRIRGTRKYQNHKRCGNDNVNMRRRITRKVKGNRRVGVVRRGGGGRGGKIYKKTKKYVRGGHGRGYGGHRRTIKKYHRH
jgi:hypothetical protein